VRLRLSDHVYTASRVDDPRLVVRGIASVTEFAESLFPPFVPDQVVQGMRNKSSYVNNRGEQMSDESILRLWKVDGEYASLLGTAMHSTIENFLNARQKLEDLSNFAIPIAEGDPYDDEIPEARRRNSTILDWLHIDQLLEHMETHNLELVCTEKCLFDPELMLAGTVDALFRNTVTGELLIYDWKRRPGMTGDPANKHENVYKFTKCDLGSPLAGLRSTQYTHATVQLNLYREILRRSEGLIVTGMCIVTIYPENDIRLTDIPIRDDLLQNMITHRLATKHLPSTKHKEEKGPARPEKRVTIHSSW